MFWWKLSDHIHFMISWKVPHQAFNLSINPLSLTRRLPMSTSLSSHLFWGSLCFYPLQALSQYVLSSVVSRTTLVLLLAVTSSSLLPVFCFHVPLQWPHCAYTNVCWHLWCSAISANLLGSPLLNFNTALDLVAATWCHCSSVLPGASSSPMHLEHF